MKGRQILIEPRAGGGHAAALVVDGRLEDLLIDPDPADPTPRPEAIHRATAGRPMKGLGGVMVDLGGSSGWLRGPDSPAPGARFLVQVSGWAEHGKAPPVSARLALRGRLAILTPGAPGLNISRSIHDPERRGELAALAARGMAGAAPGLGLILRTGSATEDDALIAAEIAVLCARAETLEAGTGPPELLLPAPGAAEIARRDWAAFGDPVIEAAGALESAGVWEDIAALMRPDSTIGQGSLTIEPTRALVAVDVNTGGDTSPAAALKANLAAAEALPRQLRLRGLGGQIVVDFAPLLRKDRPKVESALRIALRRDPIDTTLAGWTPIGHLELLRKRARRPLALILSA